MVGERVCDPEWFLVYGTIAGGVFALLITTLGLSVATLGSALLWGFIWGIVLFVFAAAFWMMLVLKMAQISVFLLFHLIYGGVLGAWVALGVFA